LQGNKLRFSWGFHERVDHTLLDRLRKISRKGWFLETFDVVPDVLAIFQRNAKA